MKWIIEEIKDIFGFMFLGAGLFGIIELYNNSDTKDYGNWPSFVSFVLLAVGLNLIISSRVSKAKTEMMKEMEEVRMSITMVAGEVQHMKPEIPKIKDIRSIEDMYKEAYEIVMSEGGTTMGNIHRKIGVDMPCALRLVTMLEERSVIGPMDSSKNHKLLIK
ncbi:MAG: DNA translocase FtsK [Candidatus Taylorbacteria bacterium]